MSPTTFPLDDVRVLDVTQVQAGPTCTQLLAWLGAEVIKVEEPGVGDRSRTERAHAPGLDSFYFLLLNANKKSVCLDLGSREGRDLFVRLAEVSDVVVENLRPGRMEELGLGFEPLRRANPAIVYASIKGFGTYGPHASMRSFENVAQAMGGALSAQGAMGGEPQLTAAAIGDGGAGVDCALGILAALRLRDRTGAAQRVEVSLQDAVVNLMRVRMVETLAAGSPARRAGNRFAGGPSLVYPCRPGGPDDYVSLTFGGEAWDSLLAIAGRADLIGDARFATEEARSQRREEVEAIISAWTRHRTKREAMDTLAAAGIPCGAVLNTLELLDDPHLAQRGMVVTVDDPSRGGYRTIGCPIKLASAGVPARPAPLLGQHTEQVLSEVLGLGSEQLAALRERDVV